MIQTPPVVTHTVSAATRSQERAAGLPLSKPRLAFIDNLRLVMIVFVLLIHTAVTYSGLGDWYYTESANLDPLSFIGFGFGMTFTQAYFMGLLFLVAGYFVPGAYDKKGPGRFILDRLVRLGIPVALYMLVIHPFILYFLLGLSWIDPKPTFLAFYLRYVSSGGFVSGTGPLWFALALLIFSGVYALLRIVRGQTGGSPAQTRITTRGTLLTILLITLSAFAIRLVQPLGTSVLNMQLCYFASYIVLFAAGIQAYRRGWLTSTPASFGMRWFWSGLILSPLVWLALMVGGDVPANGFEMFSGGLHWQSLSFAAWESFAAVAMSIGLLTLFREKLNAQGRLVKILSDNSFAVYVFHAPVLISISLLLKSLVLHPILKFGLVGPLAIAATFALTYLVLRRLPLLKKVI